MNRGVFSKELVELKDDTLKMVLMVQEIFEKSLNALIDHDVETAREVYRLDDKIDKAMDQIESRAIELIALQQPMAKDLRKIFAISKVITDLERIGDFCVNIAKETVAIGKEDHIKPLVDITKMKEIIESMLKDTMTAFQYDDGELAHNVGRQDEFIDNLYRDIYNDVLILINKDRTHINQGTKLLFVGRYLERIADHITNICEMIIFINTGEKTKIN